MDPVGNSWWCPKKDEWKCCGGPTTVRGLGIRAPGYQRTNLTLLLLAQSGHRYPHLLLPVHSVSIGQQPGPTPCPFVPSANGGSSIRADSQGFHQPTSPNSLWSPIQLCHHGVCYPLSGGGAVAGDAGPGSGQAVDPSVRPSEVVPEYSDRLRETIHVEVATCPLPSPWQPSKIHSNLPSTDTRAAQMI